MLDLKIINGKLIDGTGAPAKFADVAVQGGVIVEIGEVNASAKQTIDAQGAIVTPGFVDVHTHYDGQVSWDEELMPSVNHGVTTAVMGNCGVGFAPCKVSDRDRLIKLMEGVEDIPGTALHEGISWDWESFPEYMDAIDKLPHTIDFAVMVPHDPLRVYAMGERAMCEEQANEDEISLMHDLVREAMLAGAAGFSTGRSDSHKTADGDWTPASEAAQEELVGIAKAFKGLDFGVLQAVNDFDMMRPEDNFEHEFTIMQAYFEAGGGRPGSMSLMQRDFAPDDWRKIIAGTERMNEQGLDISLQVAPRAIGVFSGLNCTFHALMGHPSYLTIRDLPLVERVGVMRDPSFKQQLLSEQPVQLAGAGSSVPPMVDVMIGQFSELAEKLFKLDHHGVVDYEQGNDTSIAAKARNEGVSVWEKLYDLMLEDDGHALIYFPVFNYTDMNYDAVYTMLTHPKAIPGLSDGGAHVGTICDASFPSYLLQYWTRDRAAKGRESILLERAVQMLTADSADYMGMHDRGRLKVGLKADINVIDYEALSLGVPKMVQDLPAGGQRLLQPVSGYKAVFVSGVQVVENDGVLPARPGKLVRMNHSL
jgi:N-acyl-D-aspartate/D-glutamate deacylase